MFLRFLTAGPSEAAAARGWRGPPLRSITEPGLGEVPESHFYIRRIIIPVLEEGIIQRLSKWILS